MPTDLMTVRKAAELVGKVEQTLRRHIRTGRLPVHIAYDLQLVSKADVLRLWPIDKE